MPSISHPVSIELGGCGASDPEQLPAACHRDVNPRLVHNRMVFNAVLTEIKDLGLCAAAGKESWSVM